MLYFNNSKQNLFFIVLIVLFILLDLGQFFLIGTTIIPLLLCLYYAMLGHNFHHPTLLAVIALLQCLEMFCFYNFSSLALVYLIPVTALAFFFKKNLYPSHIHVITLALVGEIIQIYAVEGYFLHLLPIPHYTLIRIGGTLFIAICFSLTINIWGMQDNRG